jgi:hypothetical protein
VSLVGLSDARGGRLTNGAPTPVNESGVVAYRVPNTDGRYPVTYFPRTAGNYTLNIHLRRSGGLLATYYPFDDFQGAFAPADRFQCIDTMAGSLAGCDATRVDASLGADWGDDSPLTAAGTAFPSDHFSARWTGHVKGPADGPVTFFAAVNDGLRLWIDGVLVIDSWTTLESEVSGVATMKLNTLSTITAEYRDST